MASINSKGQIAWQTDIIPRATKKALEFFSHQEWLKESKWYLAGGTALALFAGHRISLDLDFFLPQKEFNLEQLIAKLPKDVWTTDIVREGTVYGRLFGVKVSFIAYSFFIPKENLCSFGAIQILDPRDIVVMKVIAISQRGRKRDFVDFYWYCKNKESLADILRRLPAQYPTVAHDYHHILKSFMYFADAEEDPMPKIFFDATWSEIKKYFQKEVPRITKEFLGLK